MSPPIIWTIFSSGSGCGAGIQADLHTIHALGGHGCCVISAVTAQNSLAVQRVEVLSDEVFSAQLAALAADLPAAVIKIGLIASASHVRILADFLRGLIHRQADTEKVVVIYDPVMVASTGQVDTAGNHLSAMQAQLLSVIQTKLLPMVDILTPNYNELALLSGIAFASVADTRKAIVRLIEFGVTGVCVKGGHLDYAETNNRCQNVADIENMAIDIYGDANRELILASPRLAVAHNHGFGCIFASALATAIALDYPVEDALVIAKAYLNQGMKQGYAVGPGVGVSPHLGWPTQRDDFPQVVLPNTLVGKRLGLADEMQLACDFPPCDTNQLGLYTVVDSVTWLEKVLQEGVKTLQLRIKDKSADEVVADIKAAVALGKQYQARLFINDYWQLAIELGAYGVHLGQEDMLTADFVAIRQAGLKLGLSTHGYYEILRAHAIKPSYIALGHIYPTETKEMPSKPQGLQRLQRYADLMQDYSLVAIGGISIERAPQVVATGVGSIAVVTAITKAIDYQQAIAELAQIVDNPAIARNKAGACYGG
ncbi:MAG: hydroxymethylpyrimidine kinase/phosphomethylpyrimidine kinase/thiamine-phosphate diphosphorylase [Moritella sp.]|jgi:hydroxymethylpyrimidine kinase/phosphomethylpyrimidine kinase/thiamine-phosphate diphosphorylase